MTLIEKGKKMIIEIVPQFLSGLLIIIVTYIVAKVIQYGISNLKIKSFDSKINASTSNQKILLTTLGNIMFWVIFLYGFVIALKSFGIDISSLIVVLGSLGLAIALSLQGTITEIAASFVIMFLNYYDLGDLVSIKVGGDQVMGKVDSFDLFTTTLKDGDKKYHRLPNTSIVKSHLINYYKNKEINVGFEISISNNNDIDINTLMESLKQVIQTDFTEFLKNKDMIEIFIIDMSASGTKIYVRIPIESVNYMHAKHSAQKIIREFCSKNELRLLDNHYANVKGGNSYYS